MTSRKGGRVDSQSTVGASAPIVSAMKPPVAVMHFAGTRIVCGVEYYDLPPLRVTGCSYIGRQRVRRIRQHERKA